MRVLVCLVQISCTLHVLAGSASDWLRQGSKFLTSLYTQLKQGEDDVDFHSAW